MEQRYGKTILPSKSKIKVADDVIRDVIGETEVLKVEVHGHVCKESFLVINLSDHDALLYISINTHTKCLE